jgi:ferric-chelate reductase
MAGSHVQASIVNVEALVFHVDLFLAALVAVYILGQVPALLARFSNSNEWRGWHLLRPSRVRPCEPLPFPRPLEDGNSSEVSTNVAVYAHVTHDSTQISGPSKDRSKRQPRHVKAWSSRFPRLAAILRRPLDRSTSVGQALILLVYFLAIVYPTLYRSNIFTDPIRTGYVSLSQLPVVLALAMRNNPAGTLAGASYEKVKRNPVLVFPRISYISRSTLCTDLLAR